MSNRHPVCQIFKIYQMMLDFIAGYMYWYSWADEERPALEQNWTLAHCSGV